MTVITSRPDAVRHFHVTEADLGFQPETEPYLTDDADLALDALAQPAHGTGARSIRAP
jgi:hypothetical protein